MTPMDSKAPSLISGTFTNSAHSPPSTLSASTLVEEPRKIGRPKKWTEKRFRRFSRLYSYSDLPRKDIPKALYEKDWAPGEDAVAKYSKALFGTDPRWLQLRPKNRDEMDKRIKRLRGCHKAKPNTVDDWQNALEVITSECAKLHTTSADTSVSKPTFWTETPLDDLLSQLPSGIHDTDSCSSGETDFYVATPQWPTSGDHILADELILPMSMHRATHYIQPSALKLLPLTSSSLSIHSASRSAVSTDISTSSIKQRLPQYSVRYLKNIKRLLNTPSVSLASEVATFIDASSYITFDKDIHDDSSSFSDSQFTLRPYKSGGSVSTTRIFPDTFLVLDLYVRWQGLCIPGLKPHDNLACWCAVVAQLESSKAEAWSIRSMSDALDVNGQDDFGNTILHLLAARGTSWDHILEVIELGADVNAKNFAEQNFLHVLDRSLLDSLVGDLLGPQISPIIEKLIHSYFEFEHRDFFGRNFLHVLSQAEACQLSLPLSNWMNGVQFPSTRDAFGCIPSQRQAAQVHAGDVLQIDSILAPFSTSPPFAIRDKIYQTGEVPLQPLDQTHAPSLPRANMEMPMPAPAFRIQSDILDGFSRLPLTDEEIGKHARLIETARLAADAPWIQETEGRNGLQCLAEAILDIHIEDGKIIASSTPKRKRDQRVVTPSSLRLGLRYDLVQNLVDRGVDVNNYDIYGSTVLMAFITHLSDGEDDKTLARILGYLIQNGANVHWRNREGETALHIALRLGRKVATRVLLDHGANVHARTLEGEGVLLMAQSHYLKARRNPQLYASIMVCMALAIDNGAVESPTIVQEWLWKP